MREVERMADEGDTQANMLLDAFIYQMAKDIADMSSVMYMDVDYIILTGGIAYFECVVNGIKGRIGKIAPVEVVLGEDEMTALCNGALRMLRGKEIPKEYSLCNNC